MGTHLGNNHSLAGLAQRQVDKTESSPNTKTMKYLDVPSSGSIADRTHSHNRAGQYTRNRRSPVQPIGTGRRAFIRSAFAAASAAWTALTSVQQEAWISFAADHPITDALGQTITLTGHQMFVAVGTNLQNVGSALPTTPPSTLALPSVSGANVVASVASGFTLGGYEGVTGDFVTVAFSKQMSPGRRFNKTFWQPLGSDGVLAADGEPATLGSGIYTAEFGTMIAGRVIFVKFTPINAQGWAGTPNIVRVVVTT